MRAFFNGSLEFAMPASESDGSPAWQMGWTSDTYETMTTALVLIDTTGIRDCRRVMDNIRDFTAPAVQAARAAGMKIVHTPSQPPPASGNPADVISPSVYSPGDTVFWSDQISDQPEHGMVLINWMRQAGVRDIVYVGYLANQCLLTRPAAMMNIHRYQLAFSPPLRFIVLRECTASVEELGAVGFPAREAFLNLYRIYPGAYTIDNASFLRGLGAEASA